MADVYYRQAKTGELIEILADTLKKSGSLEVLALQIAEITKDEPFLKQLLDLAIQQAESSPESMSQAVRLVTALMAVAGGQMEQQRPFTGWP